jgi:hypothetical protein
MGVALGWGERYAVCHEISVITLESHICFNTRYGTRLTDYFLVIHLFVLIKISINLFMAVKHSDFIKSLLATCLGPYRPSSGIKVHN